MLSVDIAGTLAKAITPSKGIPEQEFTALQTGMKRYIEDYLRERERGMHAWSMSPYDKHVMEQVREAAMKIKSENVRTVLWIGIGGSSLGPRVIHDVFERPESIEFIVLDTIDPAILDAYFRTIDWRHTFVIIASKSGGTLEPMSLFFLAWTFLQRARGAKAAERVIALTDPEKGALRNFCMEHGIGMLHLHPEIGGRYSIFTSIGLLPLALLEASIDQFVRGAKEMDTNCQHSALTENPAALLATVQFLLDTKRGYHLRIIMPYSQRLESIARWNQQLIAESLGKNELHNPIPIAAVGTQDQHSLLQQWIEGPRTAWHLFLREIEKPRVIVPDGVEPSFKYTVGKTFSQILDACYEGTSQALTKAKRPHATIAMQRLDEYHLGQLFFLLLTEVVLLGKLYRIDPYGQPGVESGKKITKDILSKGREE